MSIHIEKSITLADKLGGFAADPAARHLWSMSKRELVEIALRLGALCSGDCDSVEAGVRVVDHEHAALKRSGII